jgi:two-component system, chemotaxis family, sensor kinase CheA
MAIPLSLVARLEEFAETSIETSGDGRVVQYRGEIMPLLDLGRIFKGVETPRADTYQVVVHSDGQRSVGLVVAEILDIVNERIVVQRRASRAGVVGSAVIQQRVTDLIDVQAVVAAEEPAWSPRSVAA